MLLKKLKGLTFMQLSEVLLLACHTAGASYVLPILSSAPPPTEHTAVCLSLFKASTSAQQLWLPLSCIHVTDGCQAIPLYVGFLNTVLDHEDSKQHRLKCSPCGAVKC